MRGRPKGSETMRSRGSVLILAVWALFFLAALALAVGAHASAALRVAGAVSRRARTYALARAAVDRAVATIVANTNTWDGLTQDCWNNNPDAFGWQAAFDEGELSVCYRTQKADAQPITVFGVIGEEAKININEASVNLLDLFLRNVGELSEKQAQDTAKAIFAWHTKPADTGLTPDKESEYYAQFGAGVKSHNGFFDSIYELRLVRGIDDRVFGKVAPFVTVCGSGKINVNTASRQVLLCAALDRRVKASNAGALVDELIAARPFRKMLDISEKLTDNVRRDFASMRNILTVRSTCFYGEARGRLAAQGRSGRSPDADESRADIAIAFVVGDNGGILRWHEY